MQRAQLVKAAYELAADQDGVVSRAQLGSIDVTKDMVRTEVRAKRWRAHGRHTVAVHTAALTERAQWHRAVWEVCAGAALDGVTALIAAGLKGYEEEHLTVSVPHGSDPNRPGDVRVHETRMRRPDDVIDAGVPRVRPGVAAVRGALWAVSDRQAALIIVMAVQQRIAAAKQVAGALQQVKRHARREFLTVIVSDVRDGARALGELDFSRLCRQRGLPEPSRQVVRRGPRGRVYLDVCWDQLGVVVEIEGIHHGAAATQMDDALRQNALTIAHDSVLRIPLLGLRLTPDAFMNQVDQMLTARSRRAA